MMNKAVLICGVALVYLALGMAVLASAISDCSILDFLKAVPISLFRPAMLSELALFESANLPHYPRK